MYLARTSGTVWGGEDTATALLFWCLLRVGRVLLVCYAKEGAFRDRFGEVCGSILVRDRPISADRAIITDVIIRQTTVMSSVVVFDVQGVRCKVVPNSSHSYQVLLRGHNSAVRESREQVNGHVDSAVVKAYPTPFTPRGVMLAILLRRRQAFRVFVQYRFLMSHPIFGEGRPNRVIIRTGSVAVSPATMVRVMTTVVIARGRLISQLYPICSLISGQFTWRILVQAFQTITSNGPSSSCFAFVRIINPRRGVVFTVLVSSEQHPRNFLHPFRNKNVRREQVFHPIRRVLK